MIFIYACTTWKRVMAAEESQPKLQRGPSRQQSLCSKQPPLGTIKGLVSHGLNLFKALYANDLARLVIRTHPLSCFYLVY